MNTSRSGISTVVVIVVSLIVALGVAGFFIMSRRPAPSTPSAMIESNSNSEAQTTTELSQGEVSLPDIIGKGIAQECDIKTPESTPGAPVGTGKLWTSGKIGRSVMTATIGPNMTMEANAIFKDGSMYTWTQVAGTKMGFKMDAADMQAAAGKLNAQQKAQAEQIQAKMVVSCKPWVVDASKFELPTDVEFK